MRLGLDIGTNSIGWWLYQMDGPTITGIIDGGVRIFSDGRDPKSGTSLAVDRRAARAMRRRRDRYLRRRASLMRKLADAGLMPKDPIEAKKLEQLDPFELRARGLDEALPLHHLGRALFHLNQRRGFKSNRKTDRGDNESGKIKEATARLDHAMLASGARTLGEFLHKRRQQESDPRKTPPVRTRLTLAARDGDKAEAGYDFYPDRRHTEAEFDALWNAQASHHPDVLTAELRSALFETIFYQRPLKEPDVGLCYFTDERRLPRAHPLAQRRTLFETVNSLRIISDGGTRRALTLEERDQVIHLLDNKKPTKSPATMAVKLDAIAKALKLRGDQRFTLDTGGRDAIACDAVRASLIHPDRFGAQWTTLSDDQQWAVVNRIREVQSDSEHAECVAWLVEAFSLDHEHAVAVANAPLPEGYSRLGETATRRILAALKEDVITYSAAVSVCGWHHSNQRTGELLDQLPYYGEILDRHVIPGSGDPKDDPIERFGRLTNPTVHIGLNQLRRLVNKIIAKHGKPQEIVVELARELKLSKDQKLKVVRKNRENRDAALKRSEQLNELGQPDTGANRMLLRLWEELGPPIGPRCCPYSGKPISASMLFDGSCDVDHILPYSRTLDDSIANRTICVQEANRQKRNKTPWEAWGNTPQWEKIAGNLANLPENKRWRFSEDAMERFEGERSFLDRALVDTQYLARMARTYLDALYTEGGHVWVVPGRMTAMLRRHWGLNSLLPDHNREAGNSKNRTDHRHHAIDAAVIGACDRSLVKRIADAAGRDEERGESAEQVAREIPPPWDGFRADVRTQLEKIVVSHRADHGRIDTVAKRHGRDSTSGRMHNDTAYGIVDDQTVVSRVALSSLTPETLQASSKGKNIVDDDLREALLEATKGKSGKDFETALIEFASKEGPYKGIRRVRLRESLQRSGRVEISDEAGRPYKAYKGDSNHCIEIWRLPSGEIKSQVVTTYDAHQGYAPKPHPAAKRLVRLFKRDMVAIDRNGQCQICIVQKFDPANGLFLVPNNESDADARHRNKEDPFRMIQMGVGTAMKSGLRRIVVDELGKARGFE